MNIQEAKTMLTKMETAFNLAKAKAGEGEGALKEAKTSKKSVPVITKMENDVKNSQTISDALADAVAMVKLDIEALSKNAKAKDTAKKITVVSDRNLKLGNRMLKFGETATIDNNDFAKKAIKLKLIKLIK